MPTVTVAHSVKAPIEQVWASWDEFGAISKYNPNLRGSHLINSSAPTGLGAMRQCDLVDGKNYIREEVIEYVPKQKIAVDIYEGSVPFKKAVARFDFTDRGRRTDVVMTMEYQIKFGLLGRVMAVLMKPQLRKSMKALLAGNADYVENGVEILRAA